MKLSTLLKCLICGLLVLVTADLQAQLLYKTKFSAVEGYSNGWLIGQPSTGNPATGNIWSNINAFFLPEGGPATNVSNCNNGHSWWPDGWDHPWYIMTITNCASQEGALRVQHDKNSGTNSKTYFVKMGFPTTKRGPITVTWDWQFICTNVLDPNWPGHIDYDEYTNNYTGSLPGCDYGFCMADYENRWLSYPGKGDPNWIYGVNCSPVRISSLQDSRNNYEFIDGPGGCDQSGNWNQNFGPQFKDGTLLHMTQILYLTNSPPYYDTNLYQSFNTANTFDSFCQRDEPLPSGTNWQTGWKTPTYFYDAYDSSLHNITEPMGFRECPGHYDPNSGVNCITLWANGNDVLTSYALIRNIRVVGPDPIPHPQVSISKSGAVTFDAGSWLEAADSLSGPWTTVSVQAPYQVPAGTAVKFYRAVF
jgi:hypothetical protein